MILDHADPEIVGALSGRWDDDILYMQDREPGDGRSDRYSADLVRKGTGGLIDLLGPRRRGRVRHGGDQAENDEQSRESDDQCSTHGVTPFVSTPRGSGPTPGIRCQRNVRQSV